MSKMLRLFSSYSMPRAATHLTNVLGENITEASLLSLALAGRVSLSIRLPEHTPLLAVDSPDGLAYGEVQLASGSWTVVMEGGGRGLVERRLQELTGIQAKQYRHEPTLLEDSKGRRWALISWNVDADIGNPPEELDFVCDYDSETSEVSPDVLESYESYKNSLFEQPQEVPMFFVKTKSMIDFEESLQGPLKSTLAIPERDNLLSIIAGLCHKLDINYFERGVAVKIERLTEEHGYPVSNDTIRRHFKLLGDVLDKKSK